MYIRQEDGARSNDAVVGSLSLYARNRVQASDWPVRAETSVTYEFPCADGDPYYPIPRAENEALFKRYEALAMGAPEVLFVGRLATYRYYNMDQVVGQALATYRRHAAQFLRFDGASPTSIAAE